MGDAEAEAEGGDVPAVVGAVHHDVLPDVLLEGGGGHAVDVDRRCSGVIDEAEAAQQSARKAKLAQIESTKMVNGHVDEPLTNGVDS